MSDIILSYLWIYTLGALLLIYLVSWFYLICLDNLEFTFRAQTTGWVYSLKLFNLSFPVDSHSTELHTRLYCDLPVSCIFATCRTLNLVLTIHPVYSVSTNQRFTWWSGGMQGFVFQFLPMTLYRIHVVSVYIYPRSSCCRSNKAILHCPFRSTCFSLNIVFTSNFLHQYCGGVMHMALDLCSRLV